MSDVDVITDLTKGFQVTIGDNPQEVTGNRLLLNIFEITFLTKKRSFVYNDEVVQDPYGGDAEQTIGRQSVLADSQSLSAAIIIAINETVKNMKLDETPSTPLTERIDRAELLSLDIIDDIVTAQIQVFPVETEKYVDLMWNLPIIRS
jgi:hypothetical protein